MSLKDYSQMTGIFLFNRWIERSLQGLLPGGISGRMVSGNHQRRRPFLFLGFYAAGDCRLRSSGLFGRKYLWSLLGTGPQVVSVLLSSVHTGIISIPLPIPHPFVPPQPSTSTGQNRWIYRSRNQNSRAMQQGGSGHSVSVVSVVDSHRLHS